MKKEDTKYFKTDKMVDCPCGCGLTITDKGLWEKLDLARQLAGTPFRINSGARCDWYNAKIGASPTSSHTKALAVDIGVTSSPERYKILFALCHAGFKRIGINKAFLHVDVDKDKPQDLIFLY